jgi:hypothetical protein
MSKINVGRLILGGIVAGIVMDILDYPVDGVWLAPTWNHQLATWGRPPFAGSALAWLLGFGIITGIAAVWIYAGIRPRFGAGMRTAVYAGIVTWILSALLPNIALMWVTHFFSGHLTAYTTFGALFETVIGTICGAALYKEN